eukprot:TRINITY_DN2542_c0_g1_i1.p1 TRINITY_DN2542_c0_g1~~TRINITY_DN2542_c0_g1_i1.p1  ORF type:complete len:865 (+),score=252.33 TRINITY_DN2542_c0_g1_i1:247-2595(+)
MEGEEIEAIIHDEMAVDQLETTQSQDFPPTLPTVSQIPTFQVPTPSPSSGKCNVTFHMFDSPPQTICNISLDDTSLSQLKASICQSAGISSHETDPTLTTTLDVAFASHLLEWNVITRDMSLRSWGFSESNTVYCLLRESDEIKTLVLEKSQSNEEDVNLPPGSLQLTITDSSRAKKVCISVRPSEKISSLLLHLRKDFGGQPGNTLHFQDSQLDPEQTLDECAITDGSTLILKLKEPKKPHRLAMCSAWQPLFATQTSSGMSCFLSSLYMISEKADEQYRLYFYDQIVKLTAFPPAVVGMQYLKNKSEISEGYKAAISSALWKIFRMMISEKVTSNETLFENSVTYFAYIFSQKSSAAIFPQVIDTVNMTCTALYDALYDPIKIGNRSGYYNRSALPAIQTSAPVDEDLTVHEVPFVRSLLLLNRTSVEVYKGEALVRPLEEEVKKMLETRGMDWTAIERSCNQFVTTSFQCLRIVSALSLSLAVAPCLTYAANGQLGVNLGAEPCSAGTLVMFVPSLEKSTVYINPDMLAKQLDALSTSKGIKLLNNDREVKEAIMVLLDTSTSMTTYSLASGESESKEELNITLTTQQIDSEVQEFQDDVNLDMWKTLYAKNSNRVLAELSCRSKVMAAVLTNSHGNFKMKSALTTVTPIQHLKPASTSIFVKIFSAQTITFQVDVSWKVEDAMTALRKKFSETEELKHLVNSGFKITFGGRIMLNHRTLESYDVCKDSTLHLMSTWNRVPEKKSIRVKICSGSSTIPTYEITCFNTDTVYTFKLSYHL